MSRAKTQKATPAARFDPIAAPLEGIDLIEANAGTGKTWAIVVEISIFSQIRRCASALPIASGSG